MKKTILERVNIEIERTELQESIALLEKQMSYKCGGYYECKIWYYGIHFRWRVQ